MVTPSSKSWLKGVLEMQSGGYPIDEPIVLVGPDDEPMVCAFVSDVEADVFMVGFGHDNEITFFTEDVTYLLLTIGHLGDIAALHNEAAALIEELDGFRDDDGGLREGWRALVTPPNALPGAS